MEASRRGVAAGGSAGWRFFGAIVVFLLVVGTALPAILPFLLIDDAEIALRASNAVLVARSLSSAGSGGGMSAPTPGWLA